MNGHDSHSHSRSEASAASAASACGAAGGAEPSTPANGVEGSTRCDCCKSCGAILELEGCGHRFHPRCIYTFPMVQCELCSEPVGTVKIFRVFKNSANSMVRKGKWSSDEHKYANMMMKQFQMGAMPLVDGLHLRGFIANLLQCDPLRVTKKYSGHAIGKQNFFYQRNKSYCYNLHTKMQKRISSLRNHFYWHIQYRCKFGYSMNIQELKAAEADYWIREFIKFANKIGQRVEFSAAPVLLESPVPSPVKERSEPESPVQIVTAPPVRMPTTVIKIEAASPKLTPQPVAPTLEPAVTVSVGIARPSVAVDLEMEVEFKPADQGPQNQSVKGDASVGAVSPLSFDEWREEEAPSFMDVLDKALIADFAKQGSQFSATLSEILGPTSKVTSNVSLPSLASALPSLAQATAAVAGNNSRCSLRDWLLEEDSRWSDSAVGNSWSFSFPLSDCA